MLIIFFLFFIISEPPLFVNCFCLKGLFLTDNYRKAVAAVVKFHFAAVQSGNLADNRQTEAAAVFFLSGRTEETFTQMTQMAVGNLNSGIVDFDFVGGNTDGNRCALGAVFYRVVQKVAQHGSQQHKKQISGFFHDDPPNSICEKTPR